MFYEHIKPVLRRILVCFIKFFELSSIINLFQIHSFLREETQDGNYFPIFHHNVKLYSKYDCLRVTLCPFGCVTHRCYLLCMWWLGQILFSTAPFWSQIIRILFSIFIKSATMTTNKTKTRSYTESFFCLYRFIKKRFNLNQSLTYNSTE